MLAILDKAGCVEKFLLELNLYLIITAIFDMLIIKETKMPQLEFNMINFHKIQETITTRMQITEEEIEETLVEVLKKIRKKILLLKKSKP